MTGVRRGELCAVKVESVDFTPGRKTLWFERAIRRESGWGWGKGELKIPRRPIPGADLGRRAVSLCQPGGRAGQGACGVA
ncbi:hypothetical protein GCM10023175_42930 [Pseudonocardia xishanensis]|uniref:Tyr recombinase domain-containing protein n=2 Tax=Pseudonocardia xishanensis TaxID=630995 RepID=A0ABP8RVR9_9PSEU